MVKNQAALAEEKQDESPLTKAARAALAKHPENVQEATAAFELAVRKDARLRDLLTDPLIREACYAVVSGLIRRARKHVWAPPIYRADSAARVIALAASNLMTFPLPGGVLLCNADRAALATAESVYRKQSDDMRHKANWLGLILQSLPEGQLVRDALTEARLIELQREASHA